MGIIFSKNAMQFCYNFKQEFAFSSFAFIQLFKRWTLFGKIFLSAEVGDHWCGEYLFWNSVVFNFWKEVSFYSVIAFYMRSHWWGYMLFLLATFIFLMDHKHRSQVQEIRIVSGCFSWQKHNKNLLQRNNVFTNIFLNHLIMGNTMLNAGKNHEDG